MFGPVALFISWFSPLFFFPASTAGGGWPHLSPAAWEGNPFFKNHIQRRTSFVHANKVLAQLSTFLFISPFFYIYCCHILFPSVSTSFHVIYHSWREAGVSSQRPRCYAWPFLLVYITYRFLFLLHFFFFVPIFLLATTYLTAETKNEKVE